MGPRSLLEALTRDPLGCLRSSWPWRALGYLLAGGGLATVVYLAVAGVLTATHFPLSTRIPCAVAVVLFAGALTGPLERRRLALIDRDWSPAKSLPPGARRWRRPPPGRQRSDPSRRSFPAARGTGRGWSTGYGVVSVLAVGWVDLAVVLVSLGIPGFLLLAPLQPEAATWQTVAGPLAGALLLPVAAYPVSAWAGARGAVARSVLAPRELPEVVRSRARLVDAFEAERRRIERDLHDGAQQRLVALHVTLGLALLDLPPGSAAARQVGTAHDLAREALAELRELIRGVHPQILTERGLAAAVRDLAGRCTVPVDLHLDLPGRAPSSVESVAYFVVAETLANVAKHSAADRCRITAQSHDGVLRLDIEDDGVGGADPAGGTGLTGLADRVAAADGRMLLSSPPGGPTLLRVEIPCTGRWTS